MEAFLNTLSIVADFCIVIISFVAVRASIKEVDQKHGYYEGEPPKNSKPPFPENRKE